MSFIIMPKEKEPIKTTIEENIVLFPYHERGMPISVPIVSKTYCNPQYKIFRKHTDLYCFEYILSGAAYIISDKKYKVQKGDFYIVYGNTQHLYYSDPKDPPTKIAICAYGDFIGAMLSAYNVTATVFHNNKVLPILEDLLSLAKQNPDYNLFCRKTALALHKIAESISGQSGQGTVLPDYLVKAKEDIDHAEFKKINLNEICRGVGISKPQLIRSFKTYYNVTPYNYILNMKIQSAKLLLTATNLTVKEIAYKLKFADEYYFSNRFKQVTGLSPLHYRKKGEEIDL